MKYIFCSLFAILTSLLIITSSCQKDETLRNGGFTAKVNGKRWAAKSNDFKKGPYEARFLSDSALSISGYGSISAIKVFIEASRTIIPGEYILNHDYTIAGGTYVDYETRFTYQTSSSNPGKVVIKEIDQKNRLIIGTFSFDASNEENGQTIKITDGAFNIPFDLATSVFRKLLFLLRLPAHIKRNRSAIHNFCMGNIPAG